MELEFDKEIDAILRKARSGVAVASTAKAGHLDADAVAAFAENALPPKSKLLYMEHFADCDGCRKLLSQAILLNNAADATAADSSAAASAAKTALPWYSKLFRTPNMALAMGALVLTFGAFLGYLALQNRSNNSTVAEVTDQERSKGGPSTGIEAPAAMNSNAAAANAAANSTNSAAAVQGAASNTTANDTSFGNGPSDTAGSASGSAAPSDTVDQPKAAAPVPPPSAGAEKPEGGRDEKAADKAKEETKDAALSKQDSDDRIARESVPQNAKKTGPNRAAGPRMQNQVQIDGTDTNKTVAGMIAPPTKNAGGKKFDYHDGAWYDSAYHGQGTTNVRRGTEDFKKLDSGLRSIANGINGTVVVVWKSKAYRIQ